MQFRHQERGKYLLVNASGRLDASWAEHFDATFREYVRQGHHHILLDATGMSYLSSAGIRALVQVTKSVAPLQGSFHIVQANDFVRQTLTTTGFENWLMPDFPADMPTADHGEAIAGEDAYVTHVLDKSAALVVSYPAKWQPWKAVNDNGRAEIRFTHQDFALGIGAPNQPGEDVSQGFGEFLAVGGNVVYQPPRDGESPDFLLSEKDYFPKMHCIQALHCAGSMSHVIRFAPKGNKTYFGIGELAEKALSETGARMTAFAVIAEIDGLVGSSLIQSPGLLRKDRSIPFPELKEWLSFCGERVHMRKQALIFGLAARSDHGKRPVLLSASPIYPGLYMHAHAVVFPYQPMESGVIQLQGTVERLFNGSPPLALFHLLEDSRPVVGLGESSLIRGACWCAAIKNDGEDTLWE